MYGAECWTLSRTNERVFERKILRRIYDPVQDKGQWRSRYNKELYDLFKELNVSITIRVARLRWAGHVRRMDEALPRRIMYVTPIRQRRTGRVVEPMMMMNSITEQRHRSDTVMCVTL
jgi:hypothetical protein